MDNNVHINYLLNSQEFARESKNVEKSLDGVERAFDGSVEDLKESVTAQKRVLKELEASYSALEKRIKKSAPGKEQSAMESELRSIKREIDSEREALTFLEGEQKKYEKSCTTLRTKIANVKQEMSQLTEGSEAYRKKMKELGDLQDRYGDITKQGSVMADDERRYKAAGEALTGLTGIMSTSTGVGALLGASQENLERIQTRLNAVIAISIGAQQVATVMNKDSYFRLVLLNGIKNTLTATTLRLAAALGVSTVAAKALMGALTLGLSVGIGALIALMNKFSQANEKRKAELEAAQKTQADFNSSVAASAAKNITELKRLQGEWNKLTSDSEKTKFINNNKTAFERLGVAVKNVADAENILVKNAPAVVESLKAKALAAASVEMAADYYKKVIKGNMAADDRAKNITAEDMSKAQHQATKISNPIARGQFLQQANLVKVAAGFAAQAAETMRTAANKDLKTIETIMSTASRQADKATKILTAAGIQKPDTEDKKDNKAVDNKRATAAENYKKTTLSIQEEINRAILEGWQKHIDINQDGYDKELDQVELNLSREAAAMAEYKAKQLKLYQDNEKNDYVAKKGTDKGFKPSVTSFAQLPQEFQDYVAAWEQAAIEVQRKGQRQVFETMLSDYTGYANTYLQKAQEFEENLKNMEANGASQQAIAGVKQMQAEILAGLDEEMAMKDQTFVTFMDGIISMGLEELLSALSQAKTALEAAKMGGEDNQGAAVLKSKIKALEAQVMVLTQQDKAGTKADPAKKWKNTLSVMNDVKGITSDVIGNFDGLDDTTKTILDSAMNISTGVINMIIGITTLAQGSAGATKIVAEGATQAIKGVEKASVILAIVSAALQVVQAIGKFLVSIFSRDKKKEREIQRLQEQVDALKDSYEALAAAIEKAYSTDAAALIKQEEANLRKQKALIQEQIRLEEDKKKTDWGKVDGYKNAIREIDKALSEVKDRTIEAIIGTDIKNAIEEFTNAYTDAWKGDEDKKKAVKDTVRKMVQSAVTELMKSRLSPEVNKFMEFLAGAMQDGILTQAEENILSQLEQKIYEKAEGIDKNFDKYFKEEKENEDTLAGQIRGTIATEQSVSELGGIFRGIWDSIKVVEKEVSTNHLDYLRQQILLQQRIADNTARSADNSDKITKTLDALTSKLDNIDKNTKPDNGTYGL